MVFKRRIILIFVFGFFLNSCAGIISWLAAPEDIAEFPINLKEENSFNVKVDFKANTQHRDNMDKVGPYEFVITDKEIFKKLDGKTRETIKKERTNKRVPDFLGKITLKWTYSDGNEIVLKSDPNYGNVGYNYTIYLNSFWLPEQEGKEISEVTVTVEKVDTLLAGLLKNPKIWIYRGGGK